MHVHATSAAFARHPCEEAGHVLHKVRQSHGVRAWDQHLATRSIHCTCALCVCCSDEDSFLFDHDLNSYAFFDIGGVPVQA